MGAYTEIYIDHLHDSVTEGRKVLDVMGAALPTIERWNC